MAANRSARKGKLPELPDSLIFLPNADKEYHEEWHPGRNPLNFPHPFRCLLAGPPNSGKSTLVKNIILRADPPFERVVVVHCDAEQTAEYEDMDAEMLSKIPAPDSWDGEKKTMVCLDDLDYQSMSKEQKGCLDRLIGYASTHRNLSVCLAVQDAFSLPVIVRRCSNLFVLWKGIDLDSMKQLARKVGLNVKEFASLIDRHGGERNSLWFDLTSKTPYPLRRNGFEMLTRSANLNKMAE